MAQAKLYRDIDYKGGSIEVKDDIPDFRALNFNDLVSSVDVTSGTFTLFKDINYSGDSVTISAKGGQNSDGKYPNFSWLGGINDAFSSAKLNSQES